MQNNQHAYSFSYAIPCVVSNTLINESILEIVPFLKWLSIIIRMEM